MVEDFVYLQYQNHSAIQAKILLNCQKKYILNIIRLMYDISKKVLLIKVLRMLCILRAFQLTKGLASGEIWFRSTF